MSDRQEDLSGPPFTAAAWVQDARAALMFLTRIPVGSTGDLPAPDLARASRAFPLVGAGVGIVAGVVLAVAGGLGLPPLIGALLAVGAGVLVTGALHEDGLADMADGFGGGATVADKLAIMRDSRIGVFGVLALILGVGLRVAALAALATSGAGLAALVAAHAGARGAVVVVMRHLPQARADGLAFGAGRPPSACAIAGGGLGAAFVLLALGPAAGVVAVLATAAAAGLLAAAARRRIGGQTGDVLGAVEQVAEIAILLTASAMLAT